MIDPLTTIVHVADGPTAATVGEWCTVVLDDVCDDAGPVAGAVAVMREAGIAELVVLWARERGDLGAAAGRLLPALRDAVARRGGRRVVAALVASDEEVAALLVAHGFVDDGGDRAVVRRLEL
jgi:hypothetical protein